MGSTDKICRLCLNISTKHWKKLDSSKEVMLKFINLDLDLSITETPVICFPCVEILEQSRDFKVMCLKTEKLLNSSYDAEKKIKLDIRCMLKDDKNGGADENKFVCRFCLKYSQSYLRLDRLDEDGFFLNMVHKCLPEFNPDLTEHSLICSFCMEKFNVLFYFSMDCHNNDEKITKYIVANGTDCRGRVTLSNVLKFIDNVGNNVEPLKDKLENNKGKLNDNVIINVEEDDEIDESKDRISLNLNSTSPVKREVKRKRGKHVVDRKVFRCDLCGHKAMYKSDLSNHFCLNVFCNECEFRTTNIAKLRIHQQSKHEVKCHVCRKDFHWKSIDEHLKDHEEEEYERLTGQIDEIMKKRKR